MGFSTRELAEPGTTSKSQVEWEETPCLLCGSGNMSPLVEAPDTTQGGTGLWFVVVQCQDCGLCFTNPRPSEGCIGQFYPTAYRPHRAPDARHRGRNPRNKATTWRYPDMGRKSLPWLGQGRLLDFGCGGGSFLERMHRQNWQVTGIDASARAVERIRGELGLRALVGSLPHSGLRPASFDVITMWQSLEHVHQPLNVLREARRLLVPGGKLVVSVPNIDSMPFRWFGHAWFGLDLPRHLTHFAPWTLQLILQRAGFRVGPVRHIRHSRWLRASAHLACQSVEKPQWMHRWLCTKPISRLATWYAYLSKESDCMIVTAQR